MLEELLSSIKHRIASGMSGRLAVPGKGNQNSVQSCSSSSLSLAVLEGRWYGCENFVELESGIGLFCIHICMVIQCAGNPVVLESWIGYVEPRTQEDLWRGKLQPRRVWDTSIQFHHRVHSACGWDGINSYPYDRILNSCMNWRDILGTGRRGF